MKTLQIFVLDKAVQNRIREKLTQALEELGYQDEELEDYLNNGMDSRLCDLEDTIDINEFL